MSVDQVVVVGSGAAGLSAAVAAASMVRVVLITDGALGRSNSMLAQGGLQVPLGDDPSKARMLDDMQRSARVPIDVPRVRSFIDHIDGVIMGLERSGLELDRDRDGRLVRRLAGGLSEPRIVSAGDQIGPAVMRVLRRQVETGNITVLAHHRAVGLEPDREFWHVAYEVGGTRHVMPAGAVVVATGGLTYRHASLTGERTTNLPNQNHTMYDLLSGLGLEQVHEDFYQYQPFGIVEADGRGTCVPESIVNLPVGLFDRAGRELGSVAQDRLALSQLMFAAEWDERVVRTDGGPGVWLSFEDVDLEDVEALSPRVARRLRRRDDGRARILVWPFLHYHLGGFVVDSECATAAPSLYLAGEMTGGLHGRNRLMGNGFTDSLVHGSIAGRSAARRLMSM